MSNPADHSFYFDPEADHYSPPRTERAPHKPRYQPDNCPHCEYDRRFPETAEGGWVYMGNNGPIGPCPWCNPHGTYRRGWR